MESIYTEDLFDFDNRRNRMNTLTGISSIDFNVFEEAISKLEDDFNNKVTNARSQSQKLQDSLSNYVEENSGVPTTEDLETFNKMSEHEYNHYLFSNYAVALAEMKVIYLFKSLEINMKNLIRTAYPNISTKGLYKWDNMVSYFKSIDIEISLITGYLEATELRKVNNCIKHSDLISEEVKKIREFDSLSEFDSDCLILFYERTKDRIKEFFKELTDLVVKDLFEFDDKRIEAISSKYNNRMDKVMLKKFIDSLNNHL